MSDILSKFKFDEKGLIPVIAQDFETNKVLMLAYMNEEAIKKTIEMKKVHYYSRSRQKLWLKGETSGNFQLLKSMKLDCDGDTILVKVKQIGVSCHTGNETCFFNDLSDNVNEKETLDQSEISDPVHKKIQTLSNSVGILFEVFDVIKDRLQNPRKGSYTNYLFDKGIDKILKKVGEEASEVIIAAKNDSKEEMRYEISDLLYHLMVLMADKDLELNDVFEELERRR